MHYTIYFDFCGYEGIVLSTDTPGCCGVASLYNMRIDKFGATKDRAKAGKLLGELVRKECLGQGYGIVQIATSTDHKDNDNSYWEHGDVVQDAFNLLDIARGMRMRKGHKTINPNTHNEIQLFSKVLDTSTRRNFL